ncbi:unnamed protein product [Adineta steineri]|uniref:RZ-type domain-containing protein n=1 Tax=Adineta steineri TaxID=433720 RepID=A0A814BFY0_9BILA|nr:unnamed protein product [Adineta steineri]CAF1507948.1 unnamed protein product [Adineta steineri]
MSNARDRHSMKSNSSQHQDRWNGYHHTTSSNRYSENQNHYSSNKRHYNGKHESTTRLDSPPNKRLRLPPVSYPTLTKLIDKTPDEILAEMLQPNFQLNKFLNDKRMKERFDWMNHMTILLEKITQCIGLREYIIMIYGQLPDTLYLEGVYDEIRKSDPDTNQLRFKFIELFLKISNKFLAMIPHSAHSLTKIVERIELQLTKNQSESPEFEGAKEILDEVLERVKEIEKRQELLNPKASKKITTIQNNIGQPPNDFRLLSIVPDIMEILSDERPYLRKNIVNGIYENAKQYLDIHFRLLREDFIGPLRIGIEQHLSKVKGKNFNVRIYENVQSLGPRLTPRNGLVYDLVLDARVARKIFWANSRRLMYGNLLLVTFDNFRSCTFATVEDRSQIEKRFIISVKTLENFNNDQGTEVDLNKIDSSCSLTMIETTTYFAAYRPVLSALQMMPTDDRFPLGPFLLKLTNERIPPDYLTTTTTYDFTPLLVDPNSNVQTNVIIRQTLPRLRTLIKPTTIGELRISYKHSNQIEEKFKKVPVLNIDEWPTSEQLHLNPKQHEALILALTNKVALIQGPPGTGKTFLGVRITEMLLHNRSVWCPSEEQSTPILMICHTNHALDQFLELIVKRLNINEGIIRVGNQCQNSNIQRFSLYNARQRARENRSIPQNIFNRRRELLAEKMKAEGDLKLHRYKMEMSQTNILPLSSFTDYAIIDSKHLQSLLAPYNYNIVEKVLFEWFDLDSGFEQISDHLVYEDNAERDVSPMEITYNTEDELDEEQEEEQQRRRDEFDIEEYEHFSSSAVRKPEKFIVNPIKDKDDRERESETGRRKRNDNDRSIQFIIQYPTTLNDETIQEIGDDVWKLSMVQRYDLYGYWLLKYRQYLHDSISDSSRVYNQAVSALAEHNQEQDYHILKDSIIVAMTTTGAANHHRILEKLQSKIVIVEEAAAIFEAHIITALSTKCEHLILIGDHVQLKPNPNVYRLGVKYNMDVSLFERLINNNFPNVRLNIQHRMRPEIARLMKHFYDDLEDHISVTTDRAPIRGIDSNVFFIKHDYIETNVPDGSSKQNDFEGNYVIKLAQYLIKQGYESKKITILVMYLGQRQFIAKQVKQINLLRGIRIMVTDNYQGEENDIIILSLVRSNPEKDIGFLKTHNRICVALSRARCGLFVIGNMDLLAEVNDKWKNIISSLLETNSIGKGLSLSCRQHSKDKFIADKPESFAQRPEGGCRQTCNGRLKCGHHCELICHNYDYEHNDVICYKKCSERLSCGHLCRKQCHNKTPNQHDLCYALVDKIIPECGHIIRIACYEVPNVNNCKKSSSKQLACGHNINVPCRIISSSDQLKGYFCSEPCNKILSCEHKCIGKCGDCHAGRLHIACGQKCERELICSHVCKEPCAANCPPCVRECQTRCIHSKCNKKCGELCIRCKEACAYKCKHLECTRLCSEPCDRDSCNEPCNKKLKCGHTCIGMCGEPCPRECRKCNKSIVQEIFFGDEAEPDARFVFLPDCRHIIEVTALDKFVKDFVNDSNDKTAIRFPECPRCKQKIHRCTRYMPIINRVDNLISQVKKKILGDTSEEEINHRRKQLITEYEKIKTNLKEIILNQSNSDFFSILYDKNYFFCDDKLNLMTNVIEFLNEIDTILIDGRKKIQGNIFEDQINFPLRHIVKYLFTQRLGRNFAEQQLKDIQFELKRIRRLIYIETLVLSLKKTLQTNEKDGIDSMQYLTKKTGPFTDEDQKQFDDLVKKFEYLNNLPGLGINENERIAIVSALKMSKGHWYLCPNGHPYVITECGGANQESQCPDCGERIGGQNHRLLDTNSHFALMDGSKHAAWSNEANLN